MRVQFVISPAYRRKLALAKRVTTGTAPNADMGCINTPTSLQPDPTEAYYYNTNTVDPDFDIDGSLEFDDDMALDTPDAQFSGLTITRPGRDTRRWLKGYNIL
jgi:hypothetical protein